MIGDKKPFEFVSFYTTQGFGISVAFLGNIAVVSGRDVIHRGAPALGSYARILTFNDRVFGATMINRTKELNVLAKFIAKKVSIADKRVALADADFDLSQLL
jgi:NAD(P)H-nitrite reductase large subunit